jgi:hypothetical protein
MTPSGTTVATLKLDANSLRRDTDVADTYRRVCLTAAGLDPGQRPAPTSQRCAWATMLVRGCKDGPTGYKGGRPCDMCANQATWAPTPTGLQEKIRAACNTTTLARLTRFP